MNKSLICVVLVASALLLGCLGQQTGQDNANERKSISLKGVNYDSFAKCLTSNGVKFYGASWCPHCNRQKEDFGDSMKYINYIECASPGGGQTEECENARITAYPTWEFEGGKRMVGELSFQQLAENTGCALN